MANDYMAKLAADLEGSTMMREPEPMPIIYRDVGGDFDEDALLQRVAKNRRMANLEFEDILQKVAKNKKMEDLEFEDLVFILNEMKDAPSGTKMSMPNISLYNPKNRVAQDVITKQDRKRAGGGKIDSIQELASSLENYGRKGDTMLAHINPQEAQMLMEEGGSGTINPMTGLPEFYFDDPGYSDVDMSGAQGDITDTSGIGEDSEDDDYTQAELQEAEIDTTGLFDDPFTAYSDEGLGGDKFTLDPYDRASTTAALRNMLDKEGMTREQAVYYNELKDRGLSNEDAIAALAAALGTPGGAAALSAGYSDGYKYGGPMGTLGDVLAGGKDSIEAAAAKKREEQEKADREAEGPFDEPGEFQAESKNYFGDILSSLNPFAELTPEQKGVLGSFSSLGSVQERSLMDNLLGGVGSALLPTALSAAQTFGGKLTDTDIIGTFTDPATGFDYLVESGGGLQFSPGQFGEPQDDSAGEPTITKKRKVATEKPKEEEKEESKKKGFPQKVLPRLTPSDRSELEEILGINNPLLNKYATGIQALV